MCIRDASCGYRIHKRLKYQITLLSRHEKYLTLSISLTLLTLIFLVTESIEYFAVRIQADLQSLKMIFQQVIDQRYHAK